MGFATALAIGGSLLGAKMQSDAAKKATRAQTRGTDAAIEESRRQYEQTRQDYMPYTEAGYGALDRLQDPTAFEESPGYQFVKREGMQGIQGSAAARGGLYSGNALKALNEYNAGLASNEYNNWWNRQMQLVDTGRGAQGVVANAGAGNAANVGNSLIDAGRARARGAYDRSNALTGGLSNALYATGRWLDKRNEPVKTSPGPLIRRGY